VEGEEEVQDEEYGVPFRWISSGWRESSSRDETGRVVWKE